MGSKKGFFITNIAVVVSVIVVVVLLVVEGLLIGLLGQPTCDTDVISPTTSVPVSKTTTKPDPGPDEIWENPRLPLNLVPIDYTLSLRPVLELNADGLYVFYGSSSIRYTCVTSTEYVIMHSLYLNFADQWSDYLTIIDKADNSNQAIEDVMFYEKNAYIVVTLESPCEEGHIYAITFSNFWGELGEDAVGLYRSEYVNENGEKRVTAATQMQDDKARRAFPCFDEPGLKAIFTTTLYYREDLNYYALTNMLPVSNKTESIDGVMWKATTFEVTPIMSTYLIAIVVSDFSYVETFTVDGIQTRIYARKAPVENGEAKYAAELTPKILEIFTEHFNVSYPLPKSDQVAVSIKGGAMENWGLVIYQERYLLYDEAATSVYDKYTVVYVIAHELAHQWFGNLVTAAWWSDTWLNEGFASYFQYTGVSGVYPEWNTDELFVINDLQVALSVDAYSSSHPLHNPEGYFSDIIYSKGASFLRMVEEMLGEETFTNALTNYLQARKYDVATYSTLFKYWIEEAAKDDNLYLPYDLEEVLETWVLQMGYPLLTLTKNGNEVTVTQEYFLVDENDSPVSTPGSNIYNYMWYVPFNYRQSNAIGNDVTESSRTWLSKVEASTTISITDESEYILGNLDAKGYYRVAYDDAMWAAIVEKMKSPTFKDISPQNRAQLIDDVFAVTRSGKVTVEAALDLTLYLRQELDYIPWHTFYEATAVFDNLLSGSNIYGEFSKYMVSLIEPSIYKEYGWNDTDTNESLQLERMLKGRVIDGACYFGLEDCNNEATRMYRELMNDPSNNTISPTYRKFVYCFAIREGAEAEWDFAWQMYLAADSAQERRMLRVALSCSREPWILTRYLEYCLDPTLIDKQDVSATMGYIAFFEEGKYVAWSFIVNHWDNIMARAGSSPINSMLSAASARFSTESDLQLIEILRPIAGDVWTNTLNSYHNTVVDNMEWRAKNEPKVKTWLNNEAPPVVKSKKAYPRLGNVDRDVIKKKRGLFNQF